MKQVYVITEGQTGVEILKHLLPPGLVKNVGFIVRDDAYSAHSMAVTILANSRIPVVLIIDADTNDEQLIHERLDFSRWSLKQAAVDVPFDVLLAKPSIEVVFFQDQSLLETVTQHKFTELEWKLAKLQPQALLANEPGGKLRAVQKLLRSLNKESLGVLRKHSLIQSLISFLSSILENGKRRTN